MSYHTHAKKLLERNRVGALLRIFAASPDVLEYQIQSGINAARKLLDIQIDGKRVFSRIDFLVSNDQRYEDSDCADTTVNLRKRVDELFSNDPVQVLDIKQGDVFCMLLNYGIVNQLEDRIPYTFIISHTAHAYITEHNIGSMLAAMQQKSRASGLALHNLSELVMKGRIVNTFAVWHNKSLMTVGGFDLRSAKPLVSTVCDTVTGICTYNAGTSTQKEMTYHMAGCEEMIPLIRMTKNFGKCVTPIKPELTPEWGPTELDDPEGFKRSQAKLATKSLRQEHFANLEGVSADFLYEGILDLPSPQ